MAREDDLSKLDAIDGLKHVVESEWEALGAYGRHLVAPLAEILRTDPSLVRIEIVASALALQGEDGIAELLGLLGSDDFVMRHKSIIGISILDGRARWVVPRLLQVLGKESQPLIVVNIIDALGRIAGPDAIAALENMYRRAREEPGATKDLLEALERALSTASAQA